MRNRPRHQARGQEYVMKRSYEDIIKYAKRKFSQPGPFTSEFYVFNTDGWYSAERFDVFGGSFEHWKKVSGRWTIV